MILNDTFFLDEYFDDSIERVGESALAEEEQASLVRMLRAAKAVLHSLTNENLDEVRRQIHILTSESLFYREVGGMAREIHTHLSALRDAIDPKLTALASKEIPEASDKLEYVITMTEQAATKTLDIVEKKLEDNGAIAGKLDLLESLVAKLSAGEIAPEEFSSTASPLLSTLKGYNAADQNELMDIMMAQDFQDLSGQVIRKVITLVAELEHQLVNLISKFGVKVEDAVADVEAEIVRDGDAHLLNGPQTDTSAENVMSDQEDVDDILKQLGF